MSEAASTSSGQPRDTATPTTEDVRTYLEQLRPVPAINVLPDVFSSTLMAAQAKLGRHDARLLIDTTTLILNHVRPYLTDQSATQFDQILNQLRMAQVQAEQSGASGQKEENDLPQVPTPPAAATPTPPQQQASPASKLWMPGR